MGKTAVLENPKNFKKKKRSKEEIDAEVKRSERERENGIMSEMSSSQTLSLIYSKLK
jgi:hypothetical protein